jgi:NAD(P)-dependent dehydrogenase (short-subunit alcohol dehydrogenase family)
VVGLLDGRVALVSGASRGIGRAIATTFATQGADVCLVATNVALLAEVAAECEQLGVRTITQPTDVTDADACGRAVAMARESLGGLDILVNSASVYTAAPFLEHTIADFQRMMDVNVFGTVQLMQAALPGMIAQGYGRIVNISSTAGKWASRNRSAYLVSKHALVGLTRAVAIETARQGVTVNAICPGPVETDMLDELVAARARIENASPDAIWAELRAGPAIGRVLQPVEVADLTAYLASEQAGGMTGQSLALDGGILFV